MPKNEVVIDTTIGLVRSELERAMDLWPPMHSAHEGYSVILEELEELWEHVKVNQKRRDLAAMQEEAIHVAAMAARFVADLTIFSERERGSSLATEKPERSANT